MAKNNDNYYWKDSNKVNDAELLQVFPEAEQIIPILIDELNQKQKSLNEIIEDQLAVIDKEADEMSRWFWRRWLAVNEIDELSVINRRIARLKRQLRIAQGLPLPKGALSDDIIAAAKEVPIETYLDRPFKRSGSTLTGLCPFHEERTPSFHIYPDQNRGWCFGCNEGGDVIFIAMKLNSCGFKEAVLMLSGGGNE